MFVQYNNTHIVIASIIENTQMHITYLNSNLTEFSSFIKYLKKINDFGNDLFHSIQQKKRIFKLIQTHRDNFLFRLIIEAFS